MANSAIKLKDVTSALERWAPLHLAESWDNVGLLVEPSNLNHTVKNILLTNDLTEPVMEEALTKKADLIISYHPPIFAPLKRLTSSHWKQRIIIKAIENNIAVYSPHTAFDCAKGGVNDWLSEGLGEGTVEPLKVAERKDSSQSIKVVTFVPKENLDSLREGLSKAGAGIIGDYSQCSFNIEGYGTFKGGEKSNPTVGQAGVFERAAETRMEMVCSQRCLPRVAEAISKYHPYEEPAWEVYPLESKPILSVGQGRLATLSSSVTVKKLVQRLKDHLHLPHIRLAKSETGMERVSTIALCAGSGGSVLKGVKADVYLTGEMSHHEVLEACANGTHVILCEHSNTERGFLRRLQTKLIAEDFMHEDLNVSLSTKDEDPFQIV